MVFPPEADEEGGVAGVWTGSGEDVLTAHAAHTIADGPLGNGGGECEGLELDGEDIVCTHTRHHLMKKDAS